MRIYSEEEITRLYRVRRTVLEMLKDRGYFVTDEEIKMTREEFKEKFGGENLRRDNLEITTHKVIDDAEKHLKSVNPDFKPEKICVVFSNEVKNTGVKEVKSVITRMRAEDVSKGILIIQTKVSSFAKTSINEGRGTLEVFEEAELLVNITKHDLVPKHELLTPEQKKAVLEDYTVKEFQLPRILKSDPVARYFGLQRGQVVKITRKSETAGEYITYRYVVDK